jgi:MFS family permease
MAREKLKFGRYDYAGFSAFTMYSVSSLAIPLLIVAMGKSLNFPIDDGGMAMGGVLHVVRSSFMVITLLLSGVVCARLGKRITIGTSVILIGLGMLLSSFSSAYWMLIPCLIIAGLGEGVCEGILTPFVQDLHPDAPERYVNIGHSFWSVGIVFAVILAGGLQTCGVSWRTILFIIGALTVISSLSFLWKEAPGKEYPEVRESIDLAKIKRQTSGIIREKRFWICCAAMFFGAGAEFGLTFWAAAYIELNFQTSAFVASLGTGVIAIGMFIGRAAFGYFAKPERLRWFLLLAGLGTIPVTLLLAYLSPGVLPGWLLFTLVFTLLFLSGVGIAPYWPTTQVYGVTNLPDCDSTLLYVYYSLMGIPGCGFFSYLMGEIGDRFGLKGTILVVPACLVIFCSIIYWECWIRAKKDHTSK